MNGPARFHRWRERLPARLAVWLVVGALLWSARRLLGPFDAGCVRALVSVALVLWSAGSLLALARWIWRRFTYRIAVRLLVSYLLVGVVPILFLGVFTFVLVYMFVGQYAAVRYREVHEDAVAAMERAVGVAASALAAEGVAGGRRAFEGVAASGADGLPDFQWILQPAEGTAVTSAEAPALDAARLPDPEHRGAVITADGMFLVVKRRVDAAQLVALVPLTRSSARSLLAAAFFDARYVLEDDDDDDDEVNVRLETAAEDVVVAGESAAPERGWLRLLEGEGDLVDRVRVIWFWIGDPVLDLRRAGDPQTRRHLVALLKVPVVAVPGDLFQSVQVEGAFWGAALVIGGVLLMLYLGVVTLATVLVVAITRSVGRLSAGAEAVGAGRFDHRVPVRRRDQLGDLAVAFNAMTASVERMVGEVAEKERMAAELELARQIQEGLLPAATLVHGPFVVHAIFEPAAEVGGDYFDFFPLADGRLVITAGDVAGHGLPTGLVMAGVKSAVAALVAEGHRGAELLAKVNAVLRTQAERPPMVTLQAVELEPGDGVARIVSAGHTPALVLRPGAAVEEVTLSALPAGHRWPTPPEARTVPFPPGSTLLLYSDGLVEAPDTTGEPFGYERLGRELEEARGLAAADLARRLLARLEQHTGGATREDDLTILVVEHQDEPLRA